MKYITNYLWEQGLRTQNEDSIAIMQLNVGKKPALLAVVADGVGGMTNGELASGIVTNRIKCAFESLSYTPGDFRLSTLKRIIKRELYSCHRDLLQYSAMNNMSTGTTVSLICLIGRHGFILHAGDSRIYSYTPPLFAPGWHSLRVRPVEDGHTASIPPKSIPVKQLTVDHTDSQGRLTYCIGHSKYPRLLYRRIHLASNSLVLLCTDGLYRRLHHEILNLPRMITLYPNGHFLNCIYSLALSRGEKDNASAVLIQVK